jgi:hypothetical protein
LSYQYKLELAMWWLKKGYNLLPVQPNTKQLVTGYGPHVRQIRLSTEAVEWFYLRGVNMAAVGWEGAWFLDFDIEAVYHNWKEQRPEEARSYTERTPRGGYHVALVGSVPPGVQLIQGAELKKSVLVAPSIVEGGVYLRGSESDILEVNLPHTLLPLSVPGVRSPVLLENTHRSAIARSQEGKVAEIKQDWPILYYLRQLAPEKLSRMNLTGSGRWRHGLCPFHKDIRPSLWIDTERNTWGCHGCDAHGDVINLHAMLSRSNNWNAMDQLIKASHV